MSRMWRRLRYRRPKRPRRGPRKVNLEELARAISWLDEYRKFRCVDPALVEKAIEDSGVRKAKEVWRRIRTDVSKIAFVPASDKRLVRWMQVVPVLRHIAYSLLSVALALFVGVFIARFQFLIDIMVRYFWWLNIGWFLISMIILANVVLYADYYIRSKIKGMYKVYGERYRRARARIKQAVQELLLCLAEEMKKHGVKPDEFKIRMLHVDYKGIKVVRRPGYWSEYYRVIPVGLGRGGREDQA